MDTGPQKSMDSLSTLSCLGTWYQVIPDLQKCQKSVKATLAGHLPTQDTSTHQPLMQHPPIYASYPTTQEVRIPAHGDEPPDYYSCTNQASQSSISLVSEQSIVFTDHALSSDPDPPAQSNGKVVNWPREYGIREI